MAFTTIPITGIWATIAGYINDNFALIGNSGSSDHLYAPTTPLTLTNVWQVVTSDWVAGATPEGTTLNNSTGSFSLLSSGRWQPFLERVYHQHDTTPDTPVMVYIKVQTSTDEVTWVDTDFERSSIIGAATANDEPSVQSFTTAFFVDVTSVPVYFRVLVKADEDGSNPVQTELVLLKINSSIISSVPA